jgi:acetyl-CoA C-acetyltransferase
MRQVVLAGCGQAARRRDDPLIAPMDLMAEAAHACLKDAGAQGGQPDTIAVVRSFSASNPYFRCPFGDADNPPLALARRLGLKPAHAIIGPVGGHSPQWLVNRLADDIAHSRRDMVLICGGEAQRSQAQAVKAGLKLDWSEASGSAPEFSGGDYLPFNELELRHQLTFPVNVYPLFEMALAEASGLPLSAHLDAVDRLMCGMAKVAARNPMRAAELFPEQQSLTDPSPDNRMIAFPYTRRLCATLGVDQAAAVLLMSEEAADRHGVQSRVYLHGSADVDDIWHVSERRDFAASPAIRHGAAAALAQAGIGPADLAHIDLYSCFPAAVQIAAREIGLSLDDGSKLTLTGGLAAFGGPGNDYSLHAITEVIARCRQDDGWGFIYANGGYLTSHSFGVYRRQRPVRAFERIDRTILQSEVHRLNGPAISTDAEGIGRIETYTVIMERNGSSTALLIIRLEDGTRTLANSRDPQMTAKLMQQCCVGAAVRVAAGQAANSAALI